MCIDVGTPYIKLFMHKHTSLHAGIELSISDQSLETSRNTLMWVRDFTGHLRHQSTEAIRNRMVVKQAAIRVLDRFGGIDPHVCRLQYPL